MYSIHYIHFTLSLHRAPYYFCQPDQPSDITATCILHNTSHIIHRLYDANLLQFWQIFFQTCFCWDIPHETDIRVYWSKYTPWYLFQGACFDQYSTHTPWVLCHVNVGGHNQQLILRTIDHNFPRDHESSRVYIFNIEHCTLKIEHFNTVHWWLNIAHWKVTIQH